MSSNLLTRAASNRLPAPDSTPRRALGAVLGAIAIVVIALSVVVAAADAPPLALVFAGLVGAVAAFLFGRAADGAWPDRWAIAGALASASGAAIALTTASAVVAVLVAACGGAIGAGAASALLVTGVPARARWTPRYRLPLPPAVSVRRRAGFRRMLGGALASGATIALAPVASAALGTALGSAVAVAGFVALLACTVGSVRVARPTQEAETVAAVLAAGCLAVFAVGLVAAVALATTPIAVAAGIGVGVSAVAVAAALPHRARPARLAGPRSRAYRQAVSGYELNTKLAPAMGGVARSAADVSALVTEARDRGLGVRTHSTGHRASLVSAMDGEALIRVLIDEPVTVDPVSRTARVPAGAKWGDVVEAIAPHGLGAPHGSSADVGVVGYLLRGGLSFYGRGQGVAANSLVSIELVCADGTLRVVDEQRDPELFWSLRGSGGGFGIVTAVTIRLFPLTQIATGAILFDVDRAHDVARAWYEWSLDAPAEITTSLRIVEVPKLPGMPRALAGRGCVVIDGVAHRLHDGGTEPAAAAAGLIDALSAAAEPVFDSWRMTTPHEAPYTHMDLPFGLHHVGEHLMLRDLGPDGIAAFVSASIESGIMCELRQLGGALAHAPVDAGAVGLYDGAFALFAGAHAASSEAAHAKLDRLREALAPWDTGVVVPTFAADSSRPQRLFDDERAERVHAQRRRIDPDGLFAGEVAPGA